MSCFEIKLVKRSINAVILLACSVFIASCGFKSDLFLPGETTKIEELDLPAIKNLATEAVDTLNRPELPVNKNSPVGPTGVEVAIPPLPSADNSESKKQRQK